MTNESKTENTKVEASTEEVKSAEATTGTKANDNKATFGPLGKYAVIAVIMFSIISMKGTSPSY